MPRWPSVSGMWDQAAERIGETPAGRTAQRYAPWIIMPLLALLAAASPSLFDTRMTFFIVVLVTFLLMRSRMTLLPIVLVAAILVWIPQEMDKFERGIMFNVALYTLLGIGLNVVVGYAGLLDLGYVAFFAVGAYLYAILAAPITGGGQDFGTSFWLVLPMALCLAGMIGALLGVPVLRLRGDYLAIVTLGFGEIIRIMILTQDDLTNGPQGIFSIPDTTLLGRAITEAYEYYYLVIAACLLAAITTERIRASRVGRAWEAIREDEDVASAMGIDTTVYKLLAFAIGASIAGIGGVIFAAKQGSVFPSDFDLNVSINVLAIVIIGGMGNVRGVILGAFLLIALPDVLRDFSINFWFINLENIGQDYRLVIFGAALVAVMILRPEGIVPSQRRRAEFEQAELIEEEVAA